MDAESSHAESVWISCSDFSAVAANRDYCASIVQLPVHTARNRGGRRAEVHNKVRCAPQEAGRAGRDGVTPGLCVVFARGADRAIRSIARPIPRWYYYRLRMQVQTNARILTFNACFRCLLRAIMSIMLWNCVASPSWAVCRLSCFVADSASRAVQLDRLCVSTPGR